MCNKTFKEKFDVLVQLFLIIDDKRWWDSKDFGREMTAAKRIINNYPDFDFFYFLPDFYNKFNSLLGLTNKENKIKLEKLYKEWENNKKKKIELQEKQLINIELEEKKPNSILEFLKN